MCGRYLRRSDKQRIAEAFHLSRGVGEISLPPWDYNVAPTTFQPVIRRDRETGEPSLTLMRWGLVPFFAETLQSFSLSTINARAESLVSSPVFRTPLLRRRCLVPADGFYEWKKLPAPPANRPDIPRTAKKSAPARQPFVFTLADERPFAFAGVWDRWKDPTGGLLDSFTIITTEPNELTSRVHNRMPVILQPRDYATWLSAPPDRDDPASPPLQLLALLRPFPADRMAVHEAHIDVGNVRNNHPGLVNSA